MEDHFSRLLGGGVPSGPSFQASKAFAGAKPGYVFKNGDKGTGYYLDNPSRHEQHLEPSSSDMSTRKRKLQPDIGN